MKPYYEEAGITIYHGDCLAVMADWPRNDDIDLIVTSPPYNMGGEPWPHFGKSKWRNGSDASSGVSYLSHSDDLPWPEYVAWQHDVLRRCWEVLDDKGAIFYNHKPRVIGAKLWTPLELNPGLDLRQIVIWARSGGMNFNPTAYVPTHEWIMVFGKPGFRLRDKSASGLGDVWRVPQDTGTEHPCPFPIEIPTKAMEATNSEVILDPFMGSGTTLIAAKNLGRKAIGIELEEKYCEMAANRLRQSVLNFDPPALIETTT